ncbi:MAG: transglycosylase domain-containing protein [Proteobacteria bacterium]|nr:transglycosylase domain-containing protein [Pseudomonadota bacterium]MBU4295697.1 transglycosylase domain-containing protein [Pseudomonadota bacterium]MCG2749292.1 transglycosylase domain-containing protein [Desulfobulbaceae bacterium]
MAASSTNQRRIKKRPVLRAFLLTFLILILLIIGSVATFLYIELPSSRFQARYLTRLVSELTFQVEDGPSPLTCYPEYGISDTRMGYTRIPEFLQSLTARGFNVEKQARVSPRMIQLRRQLGLFPTYHEKVQAGLTILGCNNETIYAVRFPERVYQDFTDIPPVLVDSLLYIENRELLKFRSPTRNPAIEWDRLAKAATDRAIQVFKPEHDVPGGSTLATQIEKYRHSPDGMTHNVADKLRQMASASLRVYLDGENTVKARHRIVNEYLNTVPLSAAGGVGEINGIGDGMWAWYGVKFAAFNQGLNAKESGQGLLDKAWMFKHALSLIVAQRRPSGFLLADPSVLENQTNAHLRLLAREGIISQALRDEALQVKLHFGTDRPPQDTGSFISRKASNAVRLQLSELLGMQRFYDLDRLDLTVVSTLHRQTQKAVTDFLVKLRDPEFLQQNGLTVQRMMSRGDPAKVIYSFNLHELGPYGAMTRVQADNLDQPFDINIGTKLDLGSTAKLRTLVTYLEIIARLHEKYAHLDAKGMGSLKISPNDRLSRWALDYLLTSSDRSLEAMLDAALERQYSASPKETFFTGGGRHTFSNFSRKDDNSIMSVKMAMRHSVNLVLIRLMRDIAHHYMLQVPGSSARILEDMDNPTRKEYLERFADQESKVFMLRFYHKYRGKTAQQILDIMLADFKPTPRRLAAIHRYLVPEATLAEFTAFMEKHLPTFKETGTKTLQKYYNQFGPDKFSLADQGYIAQVHPLELWLASYISTHHQTNWTEIVAASEKERLAVYSWLMRTKRKNAQDRRIRNLLEMEAFLEIHKDWKRLGYPFSSLVPSYATAIGSSADRPAALAELMAILVNDGVRPPAALLTSMHFAEGTPFEVLLQRQPAIGERVIPSEVARAVRGVLRDIVQSGTAARINGALMDKDGNEIPIGGKTGTGDHRYVTYRAGGAVKESKVVNRSATFVFYIGDRFYGTLTAFVPGSDAAHFEFTSSLPVSILRLLLPSLEPLVTAPAMEPPATAKVVEPVKLVETPAPSAAPPAVPADAEEEPLPEDQPAQEEEPLPAAASATP